MPDSGEFAAVFFFVAGAASSAASSSLPKPSSRNVMRTVLRITPKRRVVRLPPPPPSSSPALASGASDVALAPPEMRVERSLQKRTLLILFWLRLEIRKLMLSRKLERLLA